MLHPIIRSDRERQKEEAALKAQIQVMKIVRITQVWGLSESLGFKKHKLSMS